jgi:hypothetical protein
MGALLHHRLHRSRAWNRSAIPIKVYADNQVIEELTLPPILIEKENQTSEATRISAHPSSNPLSAQVRQFLSTFLEDSFLIPEYKILSKLNRYVAP